MNVNEGTAMQNTDVNYHTPDFGERIVFAGFSIPVLQSLNYFSDGPDKERPDRLFIEDKRKRFLISLDADMECLNYAAADNNDYDTFELSISDKRLCFSYPLQKKHENIFMGYFRIDLTDGNDLVRICAGQLSIAPPQRYIDGLRNYSELYTLFRMFSPL